MMKVFGTSGFRGYVDGKLNPINVVKLALSFARFLGSGEVAVGMDARLGNGMVGRAFIAGLLSGGIDVVDFGLTSTPGLLHASKGRKGAAMITGSHTPPEIHGILLFREDTAEIFGEDEEKIERIFQEEDFSFAPLGGLGSLSRDDALPRYREDVRRVFPEVPKAKVVLDAGHSPAVKDFIEILPELDIKVLHGDVRGDFPERPPEPSGKSLQLLGEAVRQEGAAFGLSLDGDGDRAIFVDECGRVIPPDYLGMVFAIEEVRRKGVKRIACPVNTTGAVEALRERGIEVIYTRIGPPAMAQAILEGRAVFAFEESGKYIWPDNILYGDPVYATAQLLNLLNGRRLSDLLSWIPRRYSFKCSVPCPEEKKSEALSAIKRRIRGVGEKIEELDGIKVIFEDTSWVLLRPSGTEPVFRCRVDAPTEERAYELKRMAISLLKEILGRKCY